MDELERLLRPTLVSPLEEANRILIQLARQGRASDRVPLLLAQLDAILRQSEGVVI